MEQSAFTVENFEELSRAFELNNAQMQKACDEALSKGAMKIIAESQRNLRNNGTNTTGLLSNSGKAEKLGVNDYEVGFFSQEEGHGYAEYVEYGRKSGRMPPPKILTAWVRKKLRVRKLKDAERVAFAVARKIARKGTKAQPYFSPAVESQKKAILEEIQAAAKRIIERGK